MMEKRRLRRVPVNNRHTQDIPVMCDNCIALEAQLEQLAFEIDYLTNQRDLLRRAINRSAIDLTSILRTIR